MNHDMYVKNLRKMMKEVYDQLELTQKESPWDRMEKMLSVMFNIADTLNLLVGYAENVKPQEAVAKKPPSPPMLGMKTPETRKPDCRIMNPYYCSCSQCKLLGKVKDILKSSNSPDVVTKITPDRWFSEGEGAPYDELDDMFDHHHDTTDQKKCVLPQEFFEYITQLSLFGKYSAPTQEELDEFVEESVGRYRDCANEKLVELLRDYDGEV